MRATTLRILLAVLLLTPATTAFAQRLELQVNLADLGMGLIKPYPVETDGNSETREWAIWSPGLGQWRVLAERGAVLCVGDWFTAGMFGWDEVTVVQRGSVHKLETYSVFGTGIYRLISLDTPTCATTTGAAHDVAK